MKLRNKKTGKIYTPCNICFCESLDDLENTRWKTLKEFCDDWEDVEEPLIKDEKVRKAVRAWAESCSFPILEHYLSSGFSCFLCTVDGNDYCLDFNLCLDNLEPSKIYTIKELCGEEEE